MSGAGEMSATKVTPSGPAACAECGGPRVDAEAYTGMQVVVPGTVKSSQLRAHNLLREGAGATNPARAMTNRGAPALRSGDAASVDGGAHPGHVARHIPMGIQPSI
jgi:hypothetical protein